MKCLLTTLSLLLMFGSLPAKTSAGSLDFLLQGNSSRVYALDSAFDPSSFLGELTPPWEPGSNQISEFRARGGRLKLIGEHALGGAGAVLSIALSPDGDTALAGRMAPHQILVIRGLADSSPWIAATLDVEKIPLSFGFSPDGTRAAVGNQLNGAGKASVTLLRGLPAAPVIDRTLGLKARAKVLSAVESVEFTRRGDSLVAQIGLHDEAASPGFFLANVVLQVVHDPFGEPEVSSPLRIPAGSWIPPTPPFEGLRTGRALGDSALLCDGDTLVTPVPGALDIGQPDARIVIVRGVRTGELSIQRTLTPLDGVGIAPFQVTLANDCSAIVTNTFSSTVTRITGLLDPDPNAIRLLSWNTSYPFPAEPAVVANGSALFVHHPRPPISNVPPAAVSGYRVRDGRILKRRVVEGPVRAWLQVKDQTLATWPAGLVDYLEGVLVPVSPKRGRTLIRTVEKAVAEADRRPAAARRGMRSFRRQIRALASDGIIGDAEKALFLDVATAGLSALETK